MTTSRLSTSTDDGENSTFETDPPDEISKSLPSCRGSSYQSSAAGLKARPSFSRSRQQNSFDWVRSHGSNGHILTQAISSTAFLSQIPSSPPLLVVTHGKMPRPFATPSFRRGSLPITLLVLISASIGIGFLVSILRSLLRHEVEAKGCRMSYMRPSYVHFSHFDTEHTRFATKYSLYLYREQGIDDEDKLHGIPVLFIPGNAGSYKQVRPMAAEATNYFHSLFQHDSFSRESGVRNLDFFTVDFNEDITAFHGQTLLDQAEYLNEAIRYILSLYSDPQRAERDSKRPDPTAVVVLGHSMGGVVARAMLIQPNYQPKSINTIITMSAPHARPPVTFDGQIVHIYDEINGYWRHAYAQKWANDNPLWHVTLVSIAGGSLDTVVPSDYASLESLVPETHGFTVFTTGIPTVWTGMDHQAILWCDQFRKVVTRALYDIIDVRRASQTKPRADRVRLLRRRFLSGIEPTAERSVTLGEATTLLTLGDESGRIVPTGARLSIGELGRSSKPQAHLLPVPPHGSLGGMKRFSLITDASLDDARLNASLEVLLCSVFPHQLHPYSASFSKHIDLSDGSGAATRLACLNTASDAVLLPASTSWSRYPFDVSHGVDIRPFTYLQYDPEHLADHQFIAVIDRAASTPFGFVLAEFRDIQDVHKTYEISLAELLTLGLSFTLPADRPFAVDVTIPAATSALFEFDLKVDQSWCQSRQNFALLIRQFLDKPYESKYFVNAKQASVSFHGTAPFLPPPLDSMMQRGLAFQFWSDPVCDSPVVVSLKVDAWGSFGKLYIRYRTALAAFPLLVVSMVLRNQFRVYDESGVFISFSESLDLSLRRSIPLLLLSLTLLSSHTGALSAFGPIWSRRSGHTSSIGFQRNDLLIGTDDFLFCFLIPIIGIVCIGVCTVLHYIMLGITQALGLLFGLAITIPPGGTKADSHSPTASPTLVPTTPRRRMISTAILLFLVSTFIPYQFAYLVACLVQLFTVVRAFRISTIASSTINNNYYHYAHSILLLMMWVLPINLPILAVWVRNLAVHWLTPFSSHHNVLSIMPFILLVENLTTGRMVPRVKNRLRHVTSVLLFGTALCAAIYGMSHAYVLHYLVNSVATWLIVLHSTSNSLSLKIVGAMFDGNVNEARKGDKTP
ncbi:hypothetical protein CDD83_3378 [Cordyceps sp. RAO-2017]|nr:hypothetical protein CDD83_3378 [Cordyceps sp. RAO-2017]